MWLRKIFSRKGSTPTKIMSGELYEMLAAIDRHISANDDTLPEDARRMMHALYDTLAVLDKWDAMFLETHKNTPLTPITTSMVRWHIKDALT